MFSRRKVTFAEFTSRLDPQISELMGILRRLALECGEGVVEEIRFHRIVFGRGDVMRSFVDLFPTPDHVRVSLRTEREPKAPWVDHEIRVGSDLGTVKELLRRSYLGV